MKNAESKLKIEKFDRSLIQEPHQSISCEQNMIFFIQDDVWTADDSDQMEKDAVRPDITMMRKHMTHL